MICALKCVCRHVAFAIKNIRLNIGQKDMKYPKNARKKKDYDGSRNSLKRSTSISSL